MWRSALAGLVFPARCPGCGERAEPVCARCATTLAPAPFAPPPVGVDDWAAAFAYRGVARELVARLKYRDARAGLAWLAAAAADAANSLDRSLEWETAVVTWVPTTPARRRQRGFDHAELLARATAVRLGLPAGGLLRRLPGPPQTGRPRSERRSGPRFAPRSRPTPRSILLIDDVSTTGASLSVAAATLRASGARYVRAVTIARTPRPGDR
ncbi:MAG: ComF family protein [Acidimicrobiia bacterium]